MESSSKEFMESVALTEADLEAAEILAILNSDTQEVNQEGKDNGEDF